MPPQVETEPNSTAKPPKRKRRLEEVIADLASIEDVEYIPLRQTMREPELSLPSNIDLESPYALFSLFFTDEIMETIAKSTNTYAQRRRKELYKDTVIKGRSWKPTTAAELRVFLGILIYMGVHKSPSIYDYFRNPESVEEMQPQHSTHKYMTATRFEQLKRFIHISDPCGDELRGPGEKDWWFKLEPLASTFREASKRYYKPGSNLALDEIMIRCFARSHHTVKMHHSPTAFIARKRKRPAKTSTNGALVRRVFGDEVIKELDIPAFINDYNHYMGAVDVSNQLRANYTVHRKTYRNWLPLFYFFIDAAVVNAFRIQKTFKQQQGTPRKDLPTQYFFRQDLYTQLFQFAEEPLPTRHPAPVEQHHRHRQDKAVPCIWCQYRRRAGQLQVSRTPRSKLICIDCGNVGFCVKTACWTDFHASARPGTASASE